MSVAAVLALGADFLGVTRLLLSLLPQETVGRLRLDVLYPVGGFKRCFDSEDGYEFRYPQVSSSRRRATSGLWWTDCGACLPVCPFISGCFDYR